MRTVTLLLFIGLSQLHSQGSGDLVLYGNMGIGLSQARYQDKSGGTVARLGISASIYHLHFKFDRTVNNELSVLKPPEKITSYSGLVGISAQPFRTIPELFIVGKLGKGTGEMIKRGAVVVQRPFDDEYDFIVEGFSSTIVECDVELRFQYFGMYLGGFYESNGNFGYTGFTVGALFGIF